MKPRTHRLACSGLRLTLISTSLLGCSPLGDTVELGVYTRPAKPDAAAPEETHNGTTAGEEPAPDTAVAPRPSPSSDSGAPPERASTPPCAASGCVSSAPIVYDEPGLQCQRVIAHAQTDPSAPYAVPAVPDHYVRFTLKASTRTTFYLRSINALIGDPRALHHMRLYESHGELAEGVSFGAGTPATLRLLYSWAPGIEPLYFDPSVGVELGPDTRYTLEIHYNAVIGVPAHPDVSGFELCTTSSAPTYPISVSRIGPMQVLGSSASSECAPANQVPIQLLAVYPQFDPRGQHVALEAKGLHRNALLYDAPVDYEFSKVQLLSREVLMPGETLQASCVYSLAGEVTPNEQCSVYVLHWPAHTLVSLSLAGEPDVCM
jgi:Copper type II ascorbate-dependent monooxygenase, N-terminal domain